MNKDEMYNLIQKKIRESNNTLNSIYEVLSSNYTQYLPFKKGDNHLYIRIDNLSISDIKTIIFLAESFYCKLKFVGFLRQVFPNETVPMDVLAIPYLDIYKL